MPTLGVAAPVALAVIGRPASRDPHGDRADPPSGQQPATLAADANGPPTAPSPAVLPAAPSSGLASSPAVPAAKRAVAPAATATGVPDGTGERGSPPIHPVDRASVNDREQPPVAPTEPLSERELDVLAGLASGKTTADVAREPVVAPGAIKSHSGNIYRMLGARNRPEAIARARDRGLLP